MSGPGLVTEHHRCGGRPSASAAVLVRAMVDREIAALATTRAEDDGIRLRILMRMNDRVQAG